MREYIFLFLISFNIVSCSEENKLLLGASDELHYIKLFNKDNEFEILHNALNISKGNYQISNDTIFLTYYKGNKIFTNNELPRILLINNYTKQIKAIDNKEFCADIYINNIKAEKSLFN